MQKGRDRRHGPPVRRRSGNKVAGTVWRMYLVMECGPSLVCTRACELYGLPNNSMRAFTSQSSSWTSTCLRLCRHCPSCDIYGLSEVGRLACCSPKSAIRYYLKASICHIPQAAADFRLQAAAVTTTAQMHLAYSRLPLSLDCACC